MREAFSRLISERLGRTARLFSGHELHEGDLRVWRIFPLRTEFSEGFAGDPSRFNVMAIGCLASWRAAATPGPGSVYPQPCAPSCAGVSDAGEA